MSASESGEQLHGGRLLARRLKAHGVSKLFTLSGGSLNGLARGCLPADHELYFSRARSRGLRGADETRYDQIVEVLGGHGELVRAPENENRPHLCGRLPIQVWPNRDGQGYVPEWAV